MGASYDKLWHLLIDRHMSKTQLIKEAHISTNAMAHLGKNVIYSRLITITGPGSRAASANGTDGAAWTWSS